VSYSYLSRETNYPESVVFFLPTYAEQMRQIGPQTLFYTSLRDCSEIHTRRTNMPCEQNTEFLHVKNGGAYSNRCALVVFSTVNIATNYTDGTILILQK
jgi:hypothetical protein